METELEEYFGAVVVVQVREAIARPTAGKLEQSAIITSNGQPLVDFEKLAPVARRQIVPVETADFTLVFTARLLPAHGGRVHICYEHDGHIMRTTVRPSDIVAVSWVDGKGESRIERAPGS